MIAEMEKCTVYVCLHPFSLSLFVVIQIAQHDGSEPVGASGFCCSASSRQRKGEKLFVL